MSEGKIEREWELLNRKAVAMIRKYIDKSLFEHVSTCTNAYELWSKLESMIQKKTPRNKAHLVRLLVKLEYNDGQSMIEHLNNFKGFVNQLSKIEMKIDDELQALLLLSSLPESWDTLVVTLSNSAPDGMLTTDTVSDSLMNEEARRKERGLPSQSEANVVENRGRSNSRIKNENRGRSKTRCYDKSRGQSKSRSKIICYYCGKPNHKKLECRSLKRDQKNGTVKCDQVDPKKRKKIAQPLFLQKKKKMEFFCSEEIIISILIKMIASWIVDSGASFHVTPHGDFFSTYQPGDFGAVKMGNQETSKIVGIGNVFLKTNTDCKIVMNDVRHVPDLRLNLISAGKLDDASYMNLFSGGKWKLTRNNMIVAKGNKQGSLYVTQGKICKGEANVTCGNSCLELWHKRLGHISEKGLQILAQKALIPEVKCKAIQPCIHYLAGKQHKVSFRRGNHPHRRKYVLDLVHTDVCSMNEKSMGSALYFVTFIDNHSRKVWIYLLKTKDQVLEAFREFHAKVERETRRTFEKNPPKTPQLNGVAERMNKTIEERVRSMLSNAQLSKSFWGEAVKTTTKIVNYSPSSALDGEIPEHVWTGKKVSYEHFKVFGCRAFVHIPNDERSKLDAKTKSRDVVFLEDQTIEDTKQSGKANEDQPIKTTRPEVAPQPELRRSVREIRPSNRYPPLEYVTVVNEGEPQSFDQAMEDDHKEEWLKAMQEEMQYLHENQTYDLVELPKGRRALKNKWVYKLKTNENNKKPRHKARIVVKGCNQKEGIDFEEIFSPVVKMSSIRVVLGLAATLDLEVEQLDVKTTFLPGHDKKKIDALKKALSNSFAMKDLGSVKQILGINIIRDRSKKLLWLSQEQYIEKVLRRFNMHKSKPVSVPLAGHFKLNKKQSPTSENEKEEMKDVPHSSAVRSLMYAMICTRPVIAYAVGMVSRFLSNLGKVHWEAVKWILWYLRATRNKCLCFGKGKPELIGYIDADMAGDTDLRKSMSGYVTTFSRGAISWQS
ncbi:hypothetical protein GQ457_02G035640 [Hibiscus cannabinus]